jgi:hypothetical protein
VLPVIPSLTTLTLSPEAAWTRRDGVRPAVVAVQGRIGAVGDGISQRANESSHRRHHIDLVDDEPGNRFERIPSAVLVRGVIAGAGLP